MRFYLLHPLVLKFSQKESRARFKNHQVKFFARIRNVKSIRGGKKIIEIKLEYCLFNLKRIMILKLNFAWINFHGWPHFGILRGFNLRFFRKNRKILCTQILST